MNEKVGIYCSMCGRLMCEFKYKIMDVCDECMYKQHIRYVATTQCMYKKDGTYKIAYNEERCEEIFQQEFTLDELYPIVFTTFICSKHPNILQRVPVNSSSLIRIQRVNLISKHL